MGDITLKEKKKNTRPTATCTSTFRMLISLHRNTGGGGGDDASQMNAINFS